jgi:hypothetical protein
MKSPLKVVLKTRDADFFIRDWLRYYIRLVGSENIIVVDNHSVSRYVLDTYKEFKVKVYKTPETFVTHDAIHNSQRFPILFEELVDTCNFFTIIDTDEFLCFFDYEKNCIVNENLLQYIVDNKDSRAFTPPWIYNYNYGANFLTPKDVFDFNFNLTLNNSGSGKIILNAENIKKYPGMHIGHNAGIKKEINFGVVQPSPMLLLHLNNANWEVQINSKIQSLSNMYKCKTTQEVLNILNSKKHEKYEEKVVVSYLKDSAAFLKQKTTHISDKKPTLRTNLLREYPEGNNYSTEFLNLKNVCVKELLIKIHIDQFK